MAIVKREQAGIREGENSDPVDSVVKEMAVVVDQVSGNIVLLTRSAHEAVRALTATATLSAEAVSDAASRVERLLADLERAERRMVGAVDEGMARARARLEADVSRQVQTLRATFVVATLLMLAVVFSVEWLRASAPETRAVPQAAPASGEPRAPDRTGR